MPFPSLATLLVAGLFLHGTPSVDAGWPNSMDKEERKELDNIVESESLELNLPLMVRYLDEEGKKFALSKARGKMFEKDLKEISVVGLHAQDKAALKALLKHPSLEYVEPDHAVRALHLRGETFQGRPTSRKVTETIEYGISMVQAPALWTTPVKETMKICIVDSGYGLGHPDLPSLNDDISGASFGTGHWYTDVYSHGTHCAGVIGATSNNNNGLVGVMGPSSFKYHIGKVLDDSGLGKDSDVLLALEDCIKAGAKIINLSLGGSRASESARKAYKLAYDKDVLVLAAAGNSGNEDYSFPASYAQVMSVAAVSENMKVGGFSQYNDQVEIAAPGVNIRSTITSNLGREYGYDSWSGTSMATPFVAGVAALVWSRFPECSNNQIRNVLLRTARDVDNVGCDGNVGYGIVQAKDAFDLLKKKGCEAGDPSPTPLSKGAVGGCRQDPLYTPPPTPAPTPFNCSEKAFHLDLYTDEWGEETSWELKNSHAMTVASGDRYRSFQNYSETLCLPADEYTFIIYDSEGDGLCCEYGDGRYVVSYDGQLMKTGGSFPESETVNFGNKGGSLLGVNVVTPKPTFPPKVVPTPPPTQNPTFVPTGLPTVSPTLVPTAPPTDAQTPAPIANPTASPITALTSSPSGDSQHGPPPLDDFLAPPGFDCEDDKKWVYTNKSGDKKKCKYLSKDRESRCAYLGRNSGGEETTGFVSCPKTCESCPETDGTIPATPKPTFELTVTEVGPSCTNSKDWTFKTRGGKVKNCSYIQKSHKSRCNYVGVSISGEVVEATKACPKACKVCPTEQKSATTPSPAPESNQQCRDNPNWFYRKDGKRWRCSTLKEMPSLCTAQGKDGNGERRTGNQACPVTCGTCSVEPAHPVDQSDCKDDDLWIRRNDKGKEFDCSWAALNIEDNCKKVGRNANGKKSDAYTACPVSCGQCKK